MAGELLLTQSDAAATPVDPSLKGLKEACCIDAPVIIQRHSLKALACPPAAASAPAGTHQQTTQQANRNMYQLRWLCAAVNIVCCLGHLATNTIQKQEQYWASQLTKDCRKLAALMPPSSFSDTSSSSPPCSCSFSTGTRARAISLLLATPSSCLAGPQQQLRSSRRRHATTRRLLASSKPPVTGSGAARPAKECRGGFQVPKQQAARAFRMRQMRGHRVLRNDVTAHDLLPCWLLSCYP